jgi:hypothetical protein
MDAATRAVLNATEKLLITETGREALGALDEEAPLELRARMRRARDKHVSKYRRAASARVVEHGGRGVARPENAAVGSLRAADPQVPVRWVTALRVVRAYA